MNIDDYELNKAYVDEFGRVSGIFAADKPAGKTSHDIVYEYRKKLGTKKVGHAGALDPFASGLLIILAGKATKLSDEFLTLNKVYEAEILFGMSTTSADPEGAIVEVVTDKIKLKELKSKITESIINDALKEFQPSYNQFVPVFSSVKVDGEKLRKLARKFETFEIVQDKDKRVVKFFNNKEFKKEVELPKKEVKIYESEVLNIFTKNYEINIEENGAKICKKIDYPVSKVRIKCSKGTYMRQLAEDLGVKLGFPAMLINLRRTKVGDIAL